MHIGLNLWTTPGTWWPAGASYAADFTADRYMSEGEPIAASAAFDVARGSAKYAADSSGRFLTFEADVPARTDRGLSVEPASSNILTNPVALDTWSVTMASATPLAGSALGIFSHPMLVTDAVGHVVSRLWHPETQSVTAGQPYAISCWCRAGSTLTVGVVASVNSGNSRIAIGLSDGAVASSASGRGPVTFIGLSQHGPDSYCLRALWTPNYSGPCTVAIGPGTGVIGDTVIALGAFMEPGTAFTSPIIATGSPSARTADVVTLHLPSGTHDLTITFDDGTTQTLAGASGDYELPSLDRTTIRTIVGAG